jgi:hypothetical protein
MNSKVSDSQLDLHLIALEVRILLPQLPYRGLLKLYYVLGAHCIMPVIRSGIMLSFDPNRDSIRPSKCDLPQNRRLLPMLFTERDAFILLPSVRSGVTTHFTAAASALGAVGPSGSSTYTCHHDTMHLRRELVGPRCRSLCASGPTSGNPSLLGVVRSVDDQLRTPV